jgi:hypothetical protein
MQLGLKIAIYKGTISQHLADRARSMTGPGFGQGLGCRWHGTDMTLM